MLWWLESWALLMFPLVPRTAATFGMPQPSLQLSMAMRGAQTLDWKHASEFKHAPACRHIASWTDDTALQCKTILCR